MLGGVGEYLALVTGYRVLLVVIALCYLAAILLYPRNDTASSAIRSLGSHCQPRRAGCTAVRTEVEHARHELPTLSASRCASVLPCRARRRGMAERASRSPRPSPPTVWSRSLPASRTRHRSHRHVRRDRYRLDCFGSARVSLERRDAGPGWRRGEPTGYGVNASGQVVGARGLLPYRWSAGTATPLESLFGTFTAPPLPDDAIPLSGFGELSAVAFSINAAGHAVGRSDVTGSTGQCGALGGRVVVGDDPASSIDATGQSHQRRRRGSSATPAMVGSTEVFPARQATAVSAIGQRSGRTVNLTTFEPPAGYRNSHGYDINDAGQIVGEATVRGTDGFARVPVLWSGGTITVLEPDPPRPDGPCRHQRLRPDRRYAQRQGLPVAERHDVRSDRSAGVLRRQHQDRSRKRDQRRRQDRGARVYPVEQRI